MYNFEYNRPASLDDALKALSSGEEVKLMAGGQTLIPTLKQRLAQPSKVVDLSGIAELKGITVEGNAVVIGAMTTHATVAASAEVKAKIPALANLAHGIGDPQVRNRGTLGGSISNNDPAADYPAALMALGATVHTNKRQLAAEDFFAGMFTTALEEDEILTKVSFPVPEKAAYAKFAQPASRYALVGVFVAKTSGGVRVAVTGAGEDGVFRVSDFEAALSKNFAASALDGITVPADGLNTDIHGAADYRAHLIGVMAKRAVQAAG
ncbi:MAG: xanthine dehydrogenase family protein subunit M [Alphaproteobacteria bacterium]|nr:xanthine dehydrogenase family protein subunit M [Alphaproteobacteria bacterium]MBU0795865.1 xanthine dehydrogenase family protein subunit M [Alphaproteobacteria bacterium]MBU0887967.1 xanthine dehydrogenase family protein subunit M [Alphaproteobacteria bacterium]MBU1814810.1 xanthine dehydrogenase family protein subunit M [Alphaproteobacteria bacterium]